MELAVRQYTIESTLATIGIVQLLGVGYTYVSGFDPWALSLWALATGVFAIGTVLGSRTPGWVRGIFIGLTWFSGFQLLFGLLFTPTPPTTGTYILGTMEGVGLIIVAIAMKQWMDAGFEAATLDTEIHEQSP